MTKSPSQEWHDSKYCLASSFTEFSGNGKSALKIALKSYLDRGAYIQKFAEECIASCAFCGELTPESEEALLELEILIQVEQESNRSVVTPEQAT